MKIKGPKQNSQSQPILHKPGGYCFDNNYFFLGIVHMFIKTVSFKKISSNIILEFKMNTCNVFILSGIAIENSIIN